VRRLRWVAALALVAGIAAPAGASPLDPAPALVVTGTGPVVATFRVTTPTRLNLRDASVTIGSGTYGGVYVRSAAGVGRGGVLRVAAFDTTVDARPAVRQPPVVLAAHGGGAHPLLDPGTYTVYLLADGAADVTIPLESGRGQTLRPSLRRTTQVLHTDEREVAPDTDDAVDHVVLRHAFRQPAGSYAVLLGQFVAGSVATAPAVSACVSRDPVCAPNPGGDPATRMAATASIVQATGLSGREGRWHGVVDVAFRQTAGAGRARLAYLRLDL